MQVVRSWNNVHPVRNFDCHDELSAHPPLRLLNGILVRDLSPPLVVGGPVEPPRVLPVLDDVSGCRILNLEDLASLEHIVVAMLSHLDQFLPLLVCWLGVTAACFRCLLRELALFLDSIPSRRTVTHVAGR